MAEKYDVGKGHMFANPCIFDITLTLVLEFSTQLEVVVHV